MSLYTIKKSPVHGRGLYAKTDIPKGTAILEYKGLRCSWEEAAEHLIEDPIDPYHTFIMALDSGLVIDGARRGNAARYINHSCAPNCETIEDEHERVWIQAKKAIKAGTELVYDYALTLPPRTAKKHRLGYVCRCGAKRCRGTMLKD
ncbi:MAG: hypothetical protein RLZZ502_1325 [Pseudomonadota bacterium]|jgi:SET domain-containing protein